MKPPLPLRPTAWLFLSLVAAGAAFAQQVPTPAKPAVPPPGISTFPDLATIPGEGPVRGHFDWFRNLWIERRSDWWRQRTNDQGAVVFLGDSITQGWGSLAKDFPGLKVANRGISGDTTRGVRYRLPADVLDLHPRGVVLLIGTNDLEEGARPEIVGANVKAILAACRAADPKMPLIVCQLMPSSATKKRPAAQIKQINALLADAVKAVPGCVLVDTWTPFADAAGDARPDEFPDLLHPNAAGYTRLAATLRPALQEAKLIP